jgi:GAF domain-containing protein
LRAPCLAGFSERNICGGRRGAFAGNPVRRVYEDRVCKFRDEEIKFLKAVAGLSAVALDKARMHETLQTRCDKYRIDDN